MLKEDENNEKTKKNKNARGDDENAKNAFVAKMRPANVEGRKSSADDKKRTADDKKRTADDKKRRLADENRQKPADDRKRSAEEEMQRLKNDSANNKRRLNNAPEPR
jgi:hypothetical protein